MAEFLTTKGIASKMEDIINYAKKEIYLVSPFLQISKTFFERLNDISDRGIEIKLICREKDLKNNDWNILNEIESLTIFSYDHLHAKCYFNENTMVITSMNIYEHSEVNNREMGVFIDSKKDSDIYEKAKNETLSILKLSNIIKQSNLKRNNYNQNNQNNYIFDPKQNYNQNNYGYCIRCSNRIPTNFDRPYCEECYSIWAQFNNFDYLENVCHGCGNKEETSKGKPFCYKCYVNYQKSIVF